MSLNWKEIDKILEELPLAGSLIRNIYQPEHHSLVLELYNRGQKFKLYISLLTGATRLHTLTRKLKNPSKPPRFVSFLRAHIKNGKIISAYQLGKERIIKIRISRYDKEIILWIRLWGGSANIIATDETGNILDAHYRRPKRGEITGGFYNPEVEINENPKTQETKHEYTVRELEGAGTFNEKVEQFYFQKEYETKKEELRKSIQQQLNIRENKILSTIEKLESKIANYENFERYKQLGDIIMSSIHKIKKGDKWLKTEDFFNNNKEITINLDPRLTPEENAELFYKKYKKSKTGLSKLKEEIEIQRNNLKNIKHNMKLVKSEEIDISKLTSLKKEQDKKAKKAQHSDETGLIFNSNGFIIRVGRNARENDELLRHYARGNDFWFHARDYAGAYVFVRSKPGKSLPLDTMLDAGNLAIYYSKRKQSGEGDVYYTRVKYLRRVKEGKTGLVIPTMEKNLHIKLEPERINRLKEFL